MKHLLFTTIAAVVLVGCGEVQPPEPPDISIHHAAYKGNIKDVKQHLAAGTDVNAKGTSGWAPLHPSAISGHKEIVELLIGKGADVNAKDDNGGTPLDMAIQNKPKVPIFSANTAAGPVQTFQLMLLLKLETSKPLNNTSLLVWM